MGDRRQRLPAQPTPLLGRGADVEAAVQRLLGDGVRLLTLTGPAGVGKTRLAVAVAEMVTDAIPDGVWFVDLAPLAGAEFVVGAIALALDVSQATDRPLLDTLCDHLRDRRVLLLLDNFEHVRGAAPDVVALLEACRDVKILVTSRVVLGSRWEHVCPVAPLDVPDLGAGPPPDALADAAAVALFIQRAQAAAPGLVLDDGTLVAVAAVCARLDGLPLAIELAAARCTVLSPLQIVDRLGRGLDLLAGPAPDRPMRHRTLRDAISWSYDLLDLDEQALVRRLGIFSGSFDLDAAEAVHTSRYGPSGTRPAGRAVLGGTAPTDILDAMSRLIGASLLRRDDSVDTEPRFRMLDTMRDYALERLAAEGEVGAARRAHAAHYLSLAERAAPLLDGPNQVAWLDRLQREHDNLRVALRLAIETGDAELGLRLASAIGWFWWVRGHLSEGREWLGRLLALPGAGAPTPWRAGALDAAGALAFQQGELAIAEALHREALAIREATGDDWGLRHSLHGLGDALMYAGDFEQARGCFMRGLANARQVGDAWGEALFGFHLGLLIVVRGDPIASRPLYERALAIARQVGNPWGIAYATGGLGRAALAEGDVAGAEALFRESMLILQDVGDHFALPLQLWNVMEVAAARGEAARVLRLAGAASALREAGGYGRFHPTPAEVDRQVEAARRVLGPHAGAAAWADGLAMSPNEVTAYALAPPDATDVPPSPSAHPRSPLSPREREVTALIGRGLTNRELAAAMVITEGTARVHVAHVLAKLGLRSRVQVAAWAVEQGLVGAPVEDGPGASGRGLGPRRA